MLCLSITHNTEENYAQVEKELLAIVFSCEKYDQYVYGRHMTVQSDQKPLEIITKKSMIDAPERLQRMILRLQTYDIDVVYTRGKEMHIAVLHISHTATHMILEIVF